MEVTMKIVAEDQSLPTCRFIDLLDVHIGNQGTVTTLLKHDLLSSSRGLHLLAAAVPLMIDDDLTDKGTALIALCLKVCKKHVYNEADAAIAYDVMGKLLDRCRALPNVEIIVTTKAIMELIQQCLPRTANIEIHPSLICLHVLVKRYIKQVITHRAHIEKYLIRFLDSDDLASVMVAAKIANLLQQIRLPGESGPPKAAWREQLERLCKSAQDIMNQLYSRATDFYKNNYFENVQSDTPLTVRGHLTMALENLDQITSADCKKVTAVSRVVAFVTRLNNVMLFIQAMLVERFPGVKAVRPHPVLECVIRLLSVNVAYQSESVDLATVAVLNAGVRVRALKTLDALILCLGTNLRPYSALIFRLAFQNLRWSQDHHHLGNTGKNVRAKAYSTISLWMITLKSHQFVRPTSNGPDHEQELVNCINYDIAEKKATFELKITSNHQNNLSKRAMRKLVNSQLGKSTLALHAPGAKKSKERWNSLGNAMSLEALSCLRVLLYSCGTFLKTSTYHHVSSFLLPLCFELHRSELGTKTDPAYRLNLYECVEALQMGCKSSVSPPSQYCLQLYGMGSQDRDNKVAAFCKRAMVAMRSSFHGAPLTFPFGLEGSQQDIHNEVLSVPQHAVSERSWCTTSLLGNERIQTIQIDDIAHKNSNNVLGISIHSNDLEQNKIDGQKRKQSEEYHVKVVKSRRLSSLRPNPLDEHPNSSISIPSSDEETQLIKKTSQIKEYTSGKENDNQPLEDNKIFFCETLHEKHFQMKDTTPQEQTGCHRYTALQSSPKNSFSKMENALSVLVPIISSEQEIIYIDDDADKPVKLLLPPEESNSCEDQISGDLKISCAQVARSSQESQKKLQNDEEHSQAEKKNLFKSEVMNANLSIDDMMADFVDVVA